VDYPSPEHGPLAASPTGSAPFVEALFDFINHAPVGMHKVDQEGIILWANRRELELLGYAWEEYVGHSVFGFHEDPAVPRKLHEEVMQGKQVYNVRSAMRCKDGSLLPVLIDSNGVFADGAFLRRRTVVRPIEDLVALEREVQANRDRLEALVGERTQRLEQANRELDAFTSAVSHDLRGPVRAIAGFSALLAQRHAGRIDPHGRELLEEVRRAAARMGDLIEDLLDLSRADRLLPNRTAVDLSAMAADILRLEAEHHPSRHVHCDVDPDLVVHGDPDLLRMAMENLLANAWKFTARAKEARISVSKRREGEDVVLCIQDNGAGFDMADAGRLFQPFQRLHRRSEYDGTGIGLATVRRIIERHGGRIWAQGRPGAGAAFYFTLPSAPLPSAQPQLPPVPPSTVKIDAAPTPSR
jgi:PAS domain S-box-containing protein